MHACMYVSCIYMHACMPAFFSFLANRKFRVSWQTCNLRASHPWDWLDQLHVGPPWIFLTIHEKYGYSLTYRESGFFSFFLSPASTWFLDRAADVAVPRESVGLGIPRLRALRSTHTWKALTGSAIYPSNMTPLRLTSIHRFFNGISHSHTPFQPLLPPSVK